MFFDHAPWVLVIAQPDELRMPQPICVGPFEELNLSNRFFFSVVDSSFLHAGDAFLPVNCSHLYSVTRKRTTAVLVWV